MLRAWLSAGTLPNRSAAGGGARGNGGRIVRRLRLRGADAPRGKRARGPRRAATRRLRRSRGGGRAGGRGRHAPRRLLLPRRRRAGRRGSAARAAGARDELPSGGVVDAARFSRREPVLEDGVGFRVIRAPAREDPRGGAGGGPTACARANRPSLARGVARARVACSSEPNTCSRARGTVGPDPPPCHGVSLARENAPLGADSVPKV